MIPVWTLEPVGKKKSIRHQPARKRGDTELLQEAERAFARGKWKDALAAYKELNKRQPGQHDDALAKVQVRRYQAFLERGMFESAEQLLDVMRGQLPPDQLTDLEWRRAISLRDADAIAAIVWKRLEHQRAAGQALDPTQLESLIFSESPPPPALSTHPEVETLLAVRMGLRAICEGKPAPLATAMAAINRQSPLAHWKLLLRALDAWYSGQDETVGKCLEKLPPLTGPGGRLAEGLRLLVQENTPHSAATLAAALALHGIANPDVATDLAQTDSLCAAGDYARAFDHAASKFTFVEKDQNTIDHNVLDYFVSIFQTGNSGLREHIHAQLKPAKERQPAWFPFLRAQFAAWELPCDCVDCIAEYGRKYLNLIADRGASRQVRARAHFHLANEFVTQIKDCLLSPRLRFFLDDAIDLLETALELDPDFARAGLLLVEAHGLAANESAANKRLDQLAAKHTDNAAILRMAGKRCLQRGTLVRGLKQLEQALAIDPHLPSLKQDYIQGLLKKARADYRKGDCDKGLACFAKMRPYLHQNHREIDYWLDLDLMRLRQLEMEVSYRGETGVIQQIRAANESDWRDRPQMREALQYLFIELLGSRQRQVNTEEQKIAFFAQKTLPAALPPEQLLQLFKILEEARASAKDTPQWSAHLRQLLDAYRTHYQPERLEGMLGVLWEAMPRHIDPEAMLETCKLWSKADRHHPQLKILALAAKLFLDESAAADHLAALKQALETARQRNDSVALEKGELLRKEIMQVLDEREMDSRRYSFADDDDDEWDDLDDGSEDEDQFEFDDFPENSEDDGGSPSFEQMDRIYATWKASSGPLRSEIERALRKALGEQLGKRTIRAFRKMQSKERA